MLGLEARLASLSCCAQSPLDAVALGRVAHLLCDGEAEPRVGIADADSLQRVALTRSPVCNPAFDITPAALVTAYVTEKGVLHGADELARALKP